LEEELVLAAFIVLLQFEEAGLVAELLIFWLTEAGMKYWMRCCLF
jgi:hypothetical protein